MSKIKVVDFNNNKEQQEAISTLDDPLYKEAKVNLMAAQSGNVSKHKSLSGQPFIVCESGHLHEHANDFIVTRLNHPDFFNKLSVDTGKNTFRAITKVTANNEADHLRNWLNICANNGLSYLEVDIEFLEAVIANFRDDEELLALSEESISKYINTWRLFYSYLDLCGVEHRLKFPAKILRQRLKSNAEDQSYFLNYTRPANKRRASRTYIDPLIENRRKKKVTDYESQVLTNKQVSGLIGELNKVDRVYAVMAHVQLDTLLRINELVEYFPPEGGNKLNKKWMNAADMRQAKKVEQPFKFIGKGQKAREINLDIQTMQMISDKYITAKRNGSDVTIYDERTSIYKRKYVRTKWAEKAGRTSESKFIWLTDKGRPVSKAMYRQAFAKALKVLRNPLNSDGAIIDESLYVRPHALRHTGATLRLLKYSKLTGVDICVANIDDINIFLQNLLGHSNFETTERYITTVRKIQVGGLARKTILSQADMWKDEIENNSILKKGIDT
ncbi:tyrosine-type recombinase/integrase [Pseudoalteromonas sp. C12FD-1]|uniref:tyrosine-type recombinase/integrase n=1 Tax=Pseudoalteromonas sp. C12FD-1 TaxID=3131979 RepID=UPI00307DE197